MTGKSELGDICQAHDPMTAPLVYPYLATLDGDSLRAEYRCRCGHAWPCWWSARYAGWTAWDVMRLNQAAREKTGGDWFHRAPCHACPSCGGTGCRVWNDSRNPEIHVCANGCDGLPPGLEGAA